MALKEKWRHWRSERNRAKHAGDYLSAKKDFQRNWSLYILVLPVLVWYLIFCYLPLSGLLMAFQNFKFNINHGFLYNLFHSQWVGFDQFEKMLTSPYFFRVLWNTLRISLATLVFGFPMPIIFAIMLNEVRQAKFKRFTQTISYMPHFISLVVICGLIKDFCGPTGVISTLIANLTGTEASNMMLNPNYFTTIYVVSGIWQELGWDSILYLAALSGIDQELYEAATVDGAGRWKQTIHVTLPGILPTIVIMLIMRCGSILSVGFEKILLMKNDITAVKAEVISTFVYTRGLLNKEWSFSVATGLLNSVVNFALLMIVNKVCEKTTENSLW